MNILGDIISRTPLYAWVILAFLIYRGLQHRKDRKVSLLTSCIAPAIFIIWGLANVFISFAYPLQTAGIYTILAGAGAGIGFLVYSKKQKFYRDTVIMKKGDALPLIVNLINYLVKYGLNVYMAMTQDAAADLRFSMVYGAAAGFSVGLFIGGILNTLKNIKLLNA